MSTHFARLYLSLAVCIFVQLLQLATSPRPRIHPLLTRLTRNYYPGVPPPVSTVAPQQDFADGENEWADGGNYSAEVGNMSTPTGSRRSRNDLVVSNAGLGLRFKLYHVVNVDDRHQHVEAKLRLVTTWHDDRLSYGRLGDREIRRLLGKREFKRLKQRDHHHIALIGGASRLGIWYPRLRIQQGLGRPQYFSDTVTIITSKGDVTMAQYLLVHITCPMQLGRFPFDRQVCPISLYCITCVTTEMIWFADAEDVVVENDQYFHDKGGQQNNIFQLTGLRKNLVDKYTAVIQILMKRRSTHYVFYLCGPSILVTLVAMMQFLLPLDATDRLQINITCLLATNVLLIILHNNLSPDVRNRVPVIALFFALSMLLVTVTTAFSVIVVYLASRARHQQQPDRPPYWLRVFCWLAAKAYCMRDTALNLRRLMPKNRLSLTAKMTEQPVGRAGLILPKLQICASRVAAAEWTSVARVLNAVFLSSVFASSLVIGLFFIVIPALGY